LKKKLKRSKKVKRAKNGTREKTVRNPEEAGGETKKLN